MMNFTSRMRSLAGASPKAGRESVPAQQLDESTTAPASAPMAPGNIAPEAATAIDGDVLLQKVRQALGSMGRQLSQQHRYLYQQQKRMFKVVLEIQDNLRTLKESLANQPAAPQPEVVEQDAAPVASTETAGEPIPVQDYDLVERMGLHVGDIDEILSCLAAGWTEDATAARVAESQARIRGLRAEITTLLRMRDIELIDDVDSFEAARHRPVGTQPRPAGAAGEGVIRRIGLTYRANGKERVLQPALVVLYDDVKV